MTEDTDMRDNRLHIRVKHHLIKHGKKLHTHIKKHHKKYLLGGTIYGVSHIIILKVLALKLLMLKTFIGGLTLIGVYHPSLSNIFANMNNICINNTPVIAQQICEKNFDTIQHAVYYLESKIDPETDTIYNAQYYGIIKSMLAKYCSTNIDVKEVSSQTKQIITATKDKNIIRKIRLWKEANTTWKQKSIESNSSEEINFCKEKYLAYTMLDISKKLFLKELKKQGLLSPTAIGSGNMIIKKSDSLVINSFDERKQEKNTNKIAYTLDNLGSSSANDMANIIKNISLNASEETMNTLKEMKILTESEQKEIQKKLELRFIGSCNKNVGYHKINQYYNDSNTLTNTTLEEIKLNIGLCDSYQYIDQLDQQIKKLLIHEIGHYIYYFKDKSTNIFEDICRNKKGTTIKNTCNSDEFVTKYSQTNAEEDYAETFSRRALTEMNKDISYFSYYKKKTIATGEIIDTIHGVAKYTVDTNSLSQKFNYFDSLLLKYQKNLRI